MLYLFHSFSEAFKKLDKEGNGIVSKDDLDKTIRQALKSADIEMGEKELAEMWEYIDSNGDGKMDFKELLKATEGGNEDQKGRRWWPWWGWCSWYIFTKNI